MKCLCEFYIIFIQATVLCANEANFSSYAGLISCVVHSKISDHVQILHWVTQCHPNMPHWPTISWFESDFCVSGVSCIATVDNGQLYFLPQKFANYTLTQHEQFHFWLLFAIFVCNMHQTVSKLTVGGTTVCIFFSIYLIACLTVYYVQFLHSCYPAASLNLSSCEIICNTYHGAVKAGHDAYVKRGSFATLDD